MKSAGLCKVSSVVPVALVILLLSSFTADQLPPKAKVNIDGYSYMTFVRMGEDGPDPDGDLVIPIYLKFRQDRDKVYGSSITPSFDDSVELQQSPLINGIVNGKRFTIDTENPEDGEVESTFKGGVLKNGDKLKGTVTDGSGTFPLALNRVRKDDNFAGIYIGKVNFAGTLAPGALNNILVALDNLADKADFNVIIADPIFGGHIVTVDGDGEFDHKKGTFSFTGTIDLGIIEISGSIDCTGKIDTDVSFSPPNDGSGFAVIALEITGRGTLYCFGDKRNKKPKLGAPKPSSVTAGTTTSVKLKHRYTDPGTMISEATDGVYISGFRFLGKNIEVDLVVENSAAGKEIVLTATKSSGKTTTAKKKIKVK